MKILAIRGRNLASLAGSFAIDLTKPPLADAGLFAITGRTGAGKSTILDALCLALFDRMPRLLGAQGVEIGRAEEAPEVRLRANDVRSILRRGAGEGYAEVDFRGVDECPYRARWTARRARGQAGGRFQAQTLELWALKSGEALGGTKTEVLAKIEGRLGLTFDQFRRSVLLAQGDFAAFLRAPPGERSELLERITGTEIYGRLSMAAHRRAGEEKVALERLQARLEDQRPLDQAARAALVEELDLARQAQDAADQEHKGLEQAQGWYRGLDALQGERDQAAQALAEARAAQAAAEPRRQAWQRIRDLEVLRLSLTAWDVAAARVLKLEEAVELSLAQEQGLIAQAGEAERAAREAESAHGDARLAMTAAQPILQAARVLDTRIQEAGLARDRLEVERRQAAGQLQAAAGEEADLQGQRAAADLDRQTAADWLAAQAALEPLASSWEVCEREFARYVQASQAEDQASAALAAAQDGLRVLNDQRQTLEADIDRQQLTEVAARQAREDLEVQARAYDLASLASQREARLARQRQLADWQRQVEEIRVTRGRVRVTQDKIAAERERRDRCQASLQGVERAMVPLGVALTQAEATHRRLLLSTAANLEALRAKLQEGEPCPLCGAAHHPWAERTQVMFQDQVAAQAQQVAAIQAELKLLTTEQARYQAEVQQAGRRLEELHLDLTQDESRLQGGLQTWSANPTDPLRPVDPGQVGLLEALADAQAELAQTLTAIGRDEEIARDLAKHIKDLTGEIDQQGRKLASARQGLADLVQEINRQEQDRLKAETDVANGRSIREEAANLLDPPLAGLPEGKARLAADPQALADDCRAQVLAWRDSLRQRDAAAERVRSLEPQLAAASARRQAAAAELAQRAATVAEHTQGLNTLERERGELLEGRPAASVELELNQALSATQAKWDEARATAGRAREALTGVQGALATQRQNLADGRQAEASTGQTLSTRRAEFEVELAELRQALSHGQVWLEEERLALQALAEALDQALALVEERERNLAKHQALAAAPGLSREAVDAQLVVAAERRQSAQELWGALHGRLAEDDRRLALTLDIQAEWARQRERWQIWDALRDLIGSASGAKFRTFAQGLTLELLVAHANLHLRDLVRRYELQRVPGTEMELQVIDHEMGDEVRGIHSLSGGESFLVSLALALGLASLASDRIQVESLFIDEGFGALDADSLDLAIASLDALYSLGRQVGVISHVSTLVERIGIRVEVRKEGGGRSRLAIVSG